MRQRLQTSLQRIVVITTPGVDRNHAAFGCVGQRHRIVFGGVIDAEYDDAASLGPKRLRIAAAGGGGRQPTHVAVITARDELAERGPRLAVETRLAEPDGIEARCE